MNHLGMNAGLEHINKSYGDKQVLCDFSLVLPERGVVSLIGPSGCGKTTLLRLLAGLERAHQGNVNVPKHAKVSMLFQEDRLIPGITVLENIAVVLSAGEEKVASACLKACGLQSAANLYPGELSGGMARRVAIARAVAFGGDILLLDEPFNGLDAESLNQVINFIFGNSEAIIKKSALIVVVTHNLQAALKISEHIIFLQGTPLWVKDRLYLPPDMPAPNRQKLLEQYLP